MRLRLIRSGQHQNKVHGSHRALLTALCLCLRMQVMVALHPVQELLATFRMSDMLNPEVHPLLQISVANYFVDNNTNGGRGDVVDDTGSSGIYGQTST